MPPKRITRSSTSSQSEATNRAKRPRTRSQTPDVTGTTTSRSARSTRSTPESVDRSDKHRTKKPPATRRVTRALTREVDDTSDSSTSDDGESSDYNKNDTFPSSEESSEEEEGSKDTDSEDFEEEEEEEEDKRPKRNSRSKTSTTRRYTAQRKGTPSSMVTSRSRTKLTTATRKKPVTSSSRTIHRVNQFMPVLPLRQVTKHQDQSNMTPYEKARERLHVSAVPDSLPCREEQFLTIMGHVESAIRDSTGACVYISGVPGTGKTATVLEVIRYLQHQAEEKELPEFDFVEINGMKLADPNQAYSILWECMDRHHQDENGKRKKYTAAHALQMLQGKFLEPSDDDRTTVVLMDELDLLVTKKQTVMYNFFDWPNRPLSKLIVVAIANTMDLPERMTTNKIASRMGLARINFQPYRHDELIEIVQSRLAGIDAFAKEAVEFAARKVSAVSGDARRALDICRRAVEIVESRLANPPGDTTKPALTKVTIAVIDEAVREMFSSPVVAFVRACSLHQKLFLVSCLQASRVSGLKEIKFAEVADHHTEICKWHNLEPLHTGDMMRVCQSLAQCRAILMEEGRQDLLMKLAINIAEEDIIMACKTDKLVNRLLEKLSSLNE